MRDFFKRYGLPVACGFVAGALLASMIFVARDRRKELPERMRSLEAVTSELTAQPPAKMPVASEVEGASQAASVGETAESAVESASATSVEGPSFHLFMSSQPDLHSSRAEVKAGDTLTAIAKRHGVTIELIKRVNGLKSDKLIPGKKLKIPTYKFSVIVDKSQNTLILKGDEEVLKTYTVSTGTGNSTPTGVFAVTDKLVQPTWYKAGAVVPPDSPENVLGTRWLGLTKKGYGIHGTTEPEKLGQQVTAGCVRMKNEDVEELFAILPGGTEVTIVD